MLYILGDFNVALCLSHQANKTTSHAENLAMNLIKQICNKLFVKNAFRHKNKIICALPGCMAPRPQELTIF